MNLSVLVPFTVSKMKQALKAHSSSHFTLCLMSWAGLQTPLTILLGTPMTTLEPGHLPKCLNLGVYNLELNPTSGVGFTWPILDRDKGD